MARVFFKTGTAEVSTDPMPPSSTDNFVVLKDHGDWPDRSLTKADVVEKILKVGAGQIGHDYEATHPFRCASTSCSPGSARIWP